MLFCRTKFGHHYLAILPSYRANTKYIFYVTYSNYMKSRKWAADCGDGDLRLEMDSHIIGFGSE